MPSQPSGKPSIFDRLYRLLLLAYPVEFRVDNRSEIAGAFRKLLDEEAARAGRLAALKLWLIGVFDVISSAVGLRLEKSGLIMKRRTGARNNTGGPIPGTRWPMRDWFQDLRHCIRWLAKSPGFTFTAIAVLAIGIGANTAMFSVVNGVLLNPLPYKDSDQIVAVSEAVQGHSMGLTVPDFKMLEERGLFDSIAGYENRKFNLSGGGEPVNVEGARITEGMFRLMEAKPLIGRIFLPEEYTAGHGDVALLSEELWRREFGGNRDVVGKSIKLSSFGLTDRPFTIVGVMPAEFQYPGYQFWMPEIFSPSLERDRSTYVLEVLARLKPDVPIERIRTQLSVVSERLAVPGLLPPPPPIPVPGQKPRRIERPKPDKPQFQIRSIKDLAVGDSAQLLLMLMGAVGFVLAIGCANIANLLLARAKTREREIAVRAALGAGRWRLIRHLLTESLLLSMTGGALGLLISYWAVKALIALAGDSIPRLDEVAVDRSVLIFALLLGLVTGLVFGLAPAVRASRPDLIGSLKDGSAVSGAGLRMFKKGWARAGLVVAEIALTVVLLVGAGLMLKSFYRLLQVNPGFNPNGLLAADLWLSPGKYRGIAKEAAFYTEVLQRLKGVGPVTGAAIGPDIPTSRPGGMVGITVEGHPRTPGGSGDPISHIWPTFSQVSPGYFGLIGMPLIAGRDFADTDAVSDNVVIVSKSFADDFWPGQNPLGKWIDDGDYTWTVIGVVGDVKDAGFAEQTLPQFYLPYWQGPVREHSASGKAALSVPVDSAPGQATIIVKSDGDPLALLPVLRGQIWAVDKDQPIDRIAAVSDLVSQSKTPQRMRAVLLTVFAAVALILAATGVFGVVSYTVNQCTKEIGIRMALGATAADVQGMAIKLGVGTIAIGLVVGIAGSLALTRVISAFLFDVGPHDTVTLITAPSVLAIVALLASYIPARRAARVDPMVALRYE